MEKLKITEESKVHETWFIDIDKMTMEELPEFLRHLTEDYTHDYGTICHALTAGAVATMWAMNKTGQGEITGFQAGAIMWEFIKRWNYTDNKSGLKITDYDKMLYPQYEGHFTDKTITSNMWKIIQKEALEKYNTVDGAHPDVRKHWKSIIDGKVPFGYTVKD